PPRHRQRRLLPRERLRHRPARRPPPADHALHPTPQRESRTLQPDPGRGIPLRPDLDQRTPPHHSPSDLEHPLQLPSTTHRRRKPAGLLKETVTVDEAAGVAVWLMLLSDSRGV